MAEGEGGQLTRIPLIIPISGYISTPPWPGDEFTVFVHCPLSSENELEKVHCPNFCPLSTACPLSNFLSTGHCPIYCPLSTVQRFWVGAGGGYLCTLTNIKCYWLNYVEWKIGFFYAKLFFFSKIRRLLLVHSVL